jgi:hypothetical protein
MQQAKAMPMLAVQQAEGLQLADGQLLWQRLQFSQLLNLRPPLHLRPLAQGALFPKEDP